jgi:hypothetical protein
MFEEHSVEMRRCLAECDVVGMRRLWHYIAPKAPAPQTDAEALIVLHHARTRAATLPLKLRAYSHYWLIERGLRSDLPDKYKRQAEREYPWIADSVAIAVGSRWPEVKFAIRGAMEGAVSECYADNKRDPAIVKPRMMEMREYMRRKLFGPVSEIAKSELAKLSGRMRER